MIDTQLIKDRLTCVEYCDRQGVKLDRNNRGVSPLRVGASNKNSFAVTNDFWFDFGSGEGGDVIDLCAALEFGGDRGKAISKLAGLTGVDNDHSYDNWVKYTQNLNNKIQKWHEELRQQDIEYLRKRGISDETIKRLKIGYNGDRLVIPYWKNGYVSYYITRALPDCKTPDKKYMKAKLDGLNENIPFGMHTLDREKDTLLIAEGCFDVLSFEQEGYSVLGTLGGHFNKDQLKTVRSVCGQFQKVVLIFDNDAAGNSFATNLAKDLFRHRIEFEVGKVPSGYKDVSEFYEAGGKLAGIVETAEDGLAVLCKSFTDESEFEKFAYQVARRISRADLVKFFKAAADLDFDSDWLKEVKKICMNAPSQQMIADEVVERYKLKYNPKLGFLEFNGRFWEMISDEQVQGYVRKALGRYATGSGLGNVTKIVKTMVLTDELFNQAPVMNFINGTLELDHDTPVFREHREEDNCTHCLPYPYDRTKRCAKWEQYIESVTDGDPRKQASLQEAAGYPLLADNSIIQKAICLYGGGSNGKSVYIETIEAIYGSENTTSISINDLKDSFKVILLMNSMLNLGTEMKGDVSGAEDTFKQIVDGSSVTASYKGKDNISFKPRCKMIMSCNELPKAKDTTHGWMRRWLFIPFTLKYVDDKPTLPNERKKDKTLLPFFREPEQLSAIFNWALEGYMVLRKTKQFTEPDDSAAIQEEYRETIDPLVAYVKEFELPPPTFSIDNKDFYKDYTIWCDESGHHALARNSFQKRVASIISEYRPEIEKFNNGKTRGYKKSDEKQMRIEGEGMPWVQ